ncbi:Transient receptor potential cation channel subfamily M member 5 [Trichoplax sp. H2]|nr:Transient receptor potential cation channel subfamily M member 5 [Trichoplax sp. H2]|eukprot:RDD38233.1 Transient receptor potential cation channel subfamily M member 5 [Trichoplax sp. H2]
MNFNLTKKKARTEINFITENFHRRICNRYVKDCDAESDGHSIGKPCQCGGDEKWHQRLKIAESSFNGNWTMESCTNKSPTDAFGKIQFHRYGLKSSIAKYLRITVDDSKEYLLQLLNKYWDISDRSFIISLMADGDVGNTQDPFSFKKSLYHNLTTIANRVAVCLLTSGYHNGIIKEISRALNEDRNDGDEGKWRKKINMIGIASWGAVLNKELLLKDKKNCRCYAEYVATREGTGGSLPLDPNHTHFILADDGTNGKRKAEEILRNQLILEWLKQNKRRLGTSRIVGVVLSGNLETLRQVKDYVTNDVTVIIIEGSGGITTILTDIKSRKIFLKIGSSDLQDKHSQHGIAKALRKTIYDSTGSLVSYEDCEASLEYLKAIQKNLKRVILYQSHQDPLGQVLFQILMGRENISRDIDRVFIADGKIDRLDRNNNVKESLGTTSAQRFTGPIKIPFDNGASSCTKTAGQDKLLSNEESIRRDPDLISERISKSMAVSRSINDLSESPLRLTLPGTPLRQIPSNLNGSVSIEVKNGIDKTIEESKEEKKSCSDEKINTDVIIPSSIAQSPKLSRGATRVQEPVKLPILQSGRVKDIDEKHILEKINKDKVQLDDHLISTSISKSQALENVRNLDSSIASSLDRSDSVDASRRPIYSDDIKVKNLDETGNKWTMTNEAVDDESVHTRSINDLRQSSRSTLSISQTSSYENVNGGKLGPQSYVEDVKEFLLLEDIQSLTTILADCERKELSNCKITNSHILTEYWNEVRRKTDENACPDLSKFVTPKTLLELYELATNCIFYKLYNSRYLMPCNDNKQSCNTDERCYKALCNIGSVISKLMGHNYNNPYIKYRARPLAKDSGSSIDKIDGNNNGSLPMNDPYNQLYLWAVLTGRDKLAVYLWEQLDYPIVAALIAAHLLLRMMEKVELNDDSSDIRGQYDVQYLQNRSGTYIKLAMGVMNTYYSRKRDNAILSFMQEIPSWENISCFSIVFASSAMQDIMVQDCYQDCLNYLWTGAVAVDTPIWRVLACFICPPLISCNVVKFKEYSNSSQINNQIMGNKEVTSQVQLEELASNRSKAAQSLAKNTKNSIINYNDMGPSAIRSSRYWDFYFAPRPIFILNLFCYLVFLVTYAAFIMTQFRLYIQPIEVVLIIWVSSLLLEEIKQIMCSPKSSYTSKLAFWWEDYWNRTDALAIITFYTALILRLVPNLGGAGRFLYCIDFIVFCLRILQLLSLRVNLGPKMAMIRHMIKDLVSFLIILFVFLVAFGVASQAILNPVSKWDDTVFKRIFYVPYYRIYGELFLEESYNCNSSATAQYWAYDCAAGDIIVNILVVIYLLLTTILLLNLLIAIFNNTYTTIEDRADKIWKIQYNDLLREYLFRSPSVPPLNLFTIIKQIFPTNMTKAVADWKSFLNQLIKLEHLKIPSKNMGAAKIEELRILENKYLKEYLSHSNKELSDRNARSIENKLDSCLAQLIRLNGEILKLKRENQSIATFLGQTSLANQPYLRPADS